MGKLPAKVDRVDASAWAGRALFLLFLILSAGWFRVSIEGNPAHLVASNSERYKAYADQLKNFPAELHQILVFTEADVLSAEHLRLYEAVQQSLYSLPEVAYVGSLLSAPALSNALKLVVSEPRNSVESGLVDDVKAWLGKKDYLPSRLVSNEFDAALMIITLHPTAPAKQSIDAVTSILHAGYPKNSDVRWSLAGQPALTVALTNDVLKELFRVTLLAVVFGAALAAWVLQDLKALVTVLAVPIAAVVATVGALGWLNIALTLLSQAVLIVVFLVVFTDTLHAVHGGRNRRSLLLACALTSLTTATAAIALWFASSWVVQEFAIALLAGIVVGFVLWGLWLLASNEHSKPVQIWPGAKAWPEDMAKPVNTHARVIGAFAGFLLLVLLGLQLRTGFTLDENLPRSHKASAALSLAEQRFSGYLPLQVVVSADDQLTADPLSTDQFLAQLTRFQIALNSQDQAKDDISLHWYSVMDVLALTPGFSDERRLGALPDPLRRSLWKADNQALLLAPLTVSELLEHDSNPLEAINDYVHSTAERFGLQAGLVTGTPALIREASDVLVGDAWRSVLITLAALFLVVLGVLKSVRMALVAAVPVVFSVSGYAAALVALGEPLRHAGVIMMSVVIGLSVDNALHFMVSIKNQNNRNISIIRQCLPVLWAATLIIIVGFIALTVSQIPSLSVLGLAAATALALGFIATAILLPVLLPT